MDSNCLFCKIIEGKIPSQKVFENSKVIAIKDISPQAPIHYLFIPREHLINLNELKTNSTIMGEIYFAIQEIAEKEKFSESGYRTVINTNGNGCQSVFHLHVHVLAGIQLGGNMAGI